MELRSDRSNRILTRSLFSSNIDNIAVICGDAHQTIARYFPKGRISQAFINHPQPPDRTDRGRHGHSGEGKHLLTLDFFRILHSALMPGGTVTIVTDNQQYAQLLLSQFNEGLTDLYQNKSIGDVESAAMQSASADSSPGTVRLHRLGQRAGGGGCPLARFGHVAAASSYFDRLWNRGDKKQRWVLYAEIRE
jgi:tRNA G46 methylase TrmB